MILRNSFLFRKVAIIGVGLIGGSVGKALKKYKLAKEIYGVSRRKEALVEAVKSHAIDHGTHDIKKAVANADLVVLATPVNVVSAMFEQIAPLVKRGCVITDVGSVKGSIVGDAQDKLQNPMMFVGSHPLAGSEKRGVEFSNEDLFQGTICLMTPLEETNRGAIDRVKRMWEKLGAGVRMMTPEEHDRALGYVSHLPHLLAYALIATVPESQLPLAAAGLKDTTRIAASSPEIWNDIFIANSKNMIRSIDECVANLSMLRKAISEGDEKVLKKELMRAQTRRERI